MTDDQYLLNVRRVRAERRQRFADRVDRTSAPRRRAVATIVHDEAVFFPLWLRYYSRFFGPDDIYVLDHDTTDGSTSRDGFRRIPLHHDGVDTAWMTNQVRGLQHELLEKYDVVVVCDVDEIIAPDPASGFGDLGNYLDHFDDDFVNCFGVELLHMPGEPPIDTTQPLLAQRSHWATNALYHKPIVATTPLDWVLGFHRLTSGINNFEPDLHLIHLHRMDRDLCLDRHRLRTSRRWTDDEIREGRGAHNSIVDPDEFDRWFLHESGLPGMALEPVAYPRRWSTVL